MALKSLIDNWNISTFFFYLSLCFLRFLRKAGFRPKKDPWRYTTRTYHHVDHCSFGLAAFNLLPPLKADETVGTIRKKNIACALALFLQDYPALHKKLIWSKFSVKVKENKRLDVVVATFDADKNLQKIEFIPDEREPINHSPDEMNALSEILIDSYNQLRFAPDETRPLQLKKKIENSLRQNDKDKNLNRFNEVTDRLLSTVYVHFEDSSENRFAVPEIFQMRPFGFGSLAAHIRMNPDGRIDVWLLFNHAVIDGIPAANILKDLEHDWNAQPLEFPEEKINHFQTDDCVAYRCRLKMCISSGIFEFDKLIKIRQKLQEQLQTELSSPVTIAGMILWGLGQTTIFRNTKFLIPIQLPKDNNHEETVGLIYIRPGKFASAPATKEEFIGFQNELNRQFSGTRNRKSEQYRLLEEFSILPHSLYQLSAHSFLKPMQNVVGSAVLTILKDSSFFIAPYATTKTEATFAIGNIMNPAKGGKNVGGVTIKAPANETEKYCNAFLSVLKNYEQYVSFSPE